MTSRLRDWASPPARLFASVALVSSLAFAPPTGVSLATAGVACVLVLALERPALRRLALRALLALLALGALALPIALGRGGGEGVEVALRSGSATLVALALSTTWRAHELGPALAALGVPRALGEVVSHMTRQFAGVADEGRRLVLARKLRGGDGAVSVELVSTLLIRTALRAERVGLAAELRRGGYDRHRGFTRRDVPLLLGASALGLLAQAGRLP